MATDTASDASLLALLRNLIAALEDKKAENLKVLHVGGISDITDYLVLATGNSEPHLRALRIEAEKVLDAARARIAGMEQGGFGSGWTVVDAYQIMVHFFTAEQRENYGLEKLWNDATEVDPRTLEAKPETPKKAPKAKAAKGKTAGSAGKKPAVKKAAASKTGKKPAAKASAPAKKKPAAKRSAE